MTHGELEIYSRVHSHSDKSIVQALFIVDLTIFLFLIVLKNFSIINLQESTSLSTEHLPVHLSLSKENKHLKGNEFLKFKQFFNQVS